MGWQIPEPGWAGELLDSRGCSHKAESLRPLFRQWGGAAGGRAWVSGVRRGWWNQLEGGSGREGGGDQSISFNAKEDRHMRMLCL